VYAVLILVNKIGYVIVPALSPATTLSMSTLRETLRDLAERLSDENYDESFAQYRFWLDIGSTHGHITSQNQVEDDTWRIARPDSLKELIHPTAHLLVRFIGDIEADQTVSRHALGLHKRRCASALHSFFELNLCRMKSNPEKPTHFLTNVNLIAHWANLGYVEEAVIRNHILQSLISHPRLYDHQADALFILFKLSGATFGAYADPSVVDRSFVLLKGHCGRDPVRRRLLRVRLPRITRGGHQAKMDFQEIVDLRERDWEGLPLPPASNTGKPKPAGADQKDPAATPVITSLGLPSRDLEPRVPQQLPLKHTVTLETDTWPVSPAPHSPSVSISTMSDFTVADASDLELPLDPTVIIPHDTFYLEDGNVEVLCGNTLFRVHASVLSFHSPVLGRTLKSENLTGAESSNGCPRILFPDAATDFTTLLKIVYLPEYVTLPLFQRIVRLTHHFPQVPRTERSAELHHILVPPPDHDKVRNARRPISDHRCRPQCVSNNIRWTRPFRTTWREGFQLADSSPERGPQPVHSAGAHVGVADGVLHDGSERAGFADGRISPGRCKIVPRNPSCDDKRSAHTP